MELSGTKVVVIGGTSGIGFAVAPRAAALGAALVVASGTHAKVDAARRRLPAGAEAVVVDVTDEAQVAALFERIGPFDHLVFTAGDWGPLRSGRRLQTSTSISPRGSSRCGSGVRWPRPNTRTRPLRLAARSA